LLGGERGGKKIDGFDLGNSPSEYDRQNVAGKVIVFTTTNGTKALLHAQRPKSNVFLAGFVNLAAVADECQRHPEIDVLCAGTEREISGEDVVLAGALGNCILAQSPNRLLNDAAQIAMEIAGSIDSRIDPRALSAQLSAFTGARNLIRLGMAGDIAAAAQIDTVDIVPVFRNGRIRPLGVDSA
jgi:2-phosphosulfolactate phosphatase